MANSVKVENQEYQRL